MRPLARVIDRTAKFVETFEIRQVCSRQATYCHDAELRAYLVSSICFDGPVVCVFVERYRRYTRIKLDMTTQIEAISNMVRVAQNFGLG